VKRGSASAAAARDPGAALWQPQAVDPTPANSSASSSLPISGALATAGNLCSSAMWTHFSATSQDPAGVWSFNTAPASIAADHYAVNGKHTSRSGRSRQSANVIPFSPELKNTFDASMLFVFSL